MLVGLTICYLFLAGMVFYGNLRRTANVIFGLIAACFAFWSLGMALFVGGLNESTIRLGASLFYVAATCFAPLLFIFTLSYPCERRVDWRLGFAPVAVAAVTVALVLAYPDFIIEQIYYDSSGWNFEVNQAGYLIFAIPFVANFLAAVAVDLRRRLQRMTKHQSRQVYYMLGIVATSIPGFVVDLILPYFGNYRWIWIGPLCSIIFLVATLYSMARYKMLRIRAFLVRSVTYILLVLTLAILYSVVFFGLSQVFVPQAASQSPDYFLLNMGVALLAAFVFQPLKRFFDRYAEKILYRRNYDPQQVIDTLTKLAVRSSDIDTLLESYLRAFSEIFHPSFVAVVFADKYHKTQVFGRRKAEWLTYENLAKIDRESPSLPHKIALIIELRVSSQNIGFFVIGEGKDTREFREKDTKFFGVLANELSIALLNMFRLEEIRRFAGTLEREVNDATSRLRRTNEQLRSLDATKDEFVSMASHQLRTPLTSVKGYLSMVLEGDAGEITAPQRQLLQEAFTSSERMVHLIGDFLNVSRLQTGKFIIDRTQVDLAQLVAEEVANVSQVATAHKVVVKYRKPARFPLLYLDENKVRQVVMNLIDNAIYYSPDADSVRVKLSVEDGDAVLRVIDKGMGVSDDAKKRLFTKFFRADNARKQRPDGTGIGLFLAKKVIDGHGGSLIFESKFGKGSTFGFRLPINRLENLPKD